MRTKILIGISLFGIFCLSMYFRIFPLMDYVIQSDWVRYLGTDSWYHFRIIEFLSYNFPHLNTIDPYLLYPEPMVLGNQNFFDYFVSGIIWIISLGNPTKEIINNVCIYINPILASLTIIPVYFIGKSLFNKWVGLISACLIVIMPSEFLGRSIIGNLDHHALEVLLSTTSMMFIIVSLKSGTIKRVILASIGGILLAFYMNTWIGSLLFVFILFIYFISQYIANFLKKVPSYDLFVSSTVFWFVALVTTILLPHSEIQYYSLLIAVFSGIALHTLTLDFIRLKLSNNKYLAILFASGCLFIVLVYFIKPDMIQTILYQFGVLNPEGNRLTIEEARSILFPAGEFTLEVVWINFTTGSFLCLIGLFLLLRKKEYLILVVWSLVIILITISMRRFSYYLTINVALLTGYVAYLVGKYFWFISKKIKKKEEIRESGIFRKGIGVFVLFFVVLFPNLFFTNQVSRQLQFAPNNAWYDAMEWVKSNLSDNYDYLGNNKRFYVHDNYTGIDNFTQPSDSFGILAQWDYGYWITSMGNRPPYINPGVINGRDKVGKFIVSTNLTDFVPKYVLMTFETAIPSYKYYSFLEYAGIDNNDYYEYFIQKDGTPVLLFYPSYYQSVGIRLYNFDNQKTIGSEAIAVKYSVVNNEKHVLAVQVFRTYQEALNYAKTQQNCIAGGASPFASIVDLNPVDGYKLVYSSPYKIKIPELDGLTSEIKIFEDVK